MTNIIHSLGKWWLYSVVRQHFQCVDFTASSITNNLLPAAVQDLSSSTSTFVIA